jgi:hypothetical protein
MPKKMKLNLDDLKVSSFKTSENLKGAQRMAVRYEQKNDRPTDLQHCDTNDLYCETERYHCRTTFCRMI